MYSRPLLTALVAMLGVAACTDGVRGPTEALAVPDSALMNRGKGPPSRVTASALWNQRTREVISRRGGSSNIAARTFALVSVAQYDAVVAAGRWKHRGAHASESAAAAAASAAVLAGLYSVEQAFVDTQLAADSVYFTSQPSERHNDFAAGAAVGRAVAAAVLAHAATDGSKTPWTGTVPVGPSNWTPISMPPQDANWGGVRTWFMRSPAQFRPVPPPAITSRRYLRDLAEVRYLSDNRTEEQLAIARYWATGYGAGGPAGFFGSVGVDLAARRHLNERQASELFAVMHMAIMDASIGCYEAKYLYWYIRPYQADPVITVPVSRPNFPSYPSAHSCLSSAGAGVLAGYFPSERRELDAMVEEAGVSRIYAGLHFRFDITAGQKLGYSVAKLALRRAPRGERLIDLR
jgi:membrane-associated phospholipid phosphatase